MTKQEKSYCLGIEFGSTRIKTALIDREHNVAASGSYSWKSTFENGIWTYALEEALAGLKQALAGIPETEKIAAAGISGMMHGYLAFDKNWKLLTPFRTWQNTITGEAAAQLTEAFGFNIPQRWSIAHLYQAVLNGEAHVEKVAHITTLAGYLHFLLTGVNAVGVGEASGMFPIDSNTGTYNEEMLRVFERLTAEQPWNVRDVLPAVLSAGTPAGNLTEEGAALLNGALPVGTPFFPPEGDAGTGMAATNAVAPKTGNVSAGTSIFSMVVLEQQLPEVHTEIDMVATPDGAPVAMVHCNNCTNDMNAWISLLREAAELFGGPVSEGELYQKLYQKSLEGDPDCGNVLVYNYLAGEGVTHMDNGLAAVLRTANSKFNLANFMRAQLYSSIATLTLGMKILTKEGVAIDTLNGHGGLFKTPGVAQNYLAAACQTPITVMQTAGEGGPYGMALLAAYGIWREAGESLSQYLNEKVFANALKTTVTPDRETVAGFEDFLHRYEKELIALKTAEEIW